jgi:hypothetical protein
MSNDKIFTTSVNPDFNTWITDVINNYRFTHPQITTKKNMKRLKKCFEILTIKKSGFFVSDFREISQESFGQFILRNKPLITTVAKTRPKQYGLVGLYINKLTEYRTDNIEVSKDFDSLVQRLKRFQPSQFHNFRVETFADKRLFLRLKDMSLPVINNSMITYDLGQIEPNRSCKINIYSNGKILFMVGCTNVPYIFTSSGLDDMIEFLTEARLMIRLYTNLDVNFPRISTWKVVWYDLNHDELTISDREFAYSFEQLQLYTHKNKVDGKTYLRYEEHRNPKDETIGSLKDRMDDYQSEIEQEKIKESKKSLDQEEESKKLDIQRYLDKIDDIL